MTQYQAQIMLLCLESASDTMKHKMVSDFTREKCFSIRTRSPSFFHNSAQCPGGGKTLLSTLKPNTRYIIFFYAISFCRDKCHVCDTMECTSLINTPSEHKSTEFGNTCTTLPHQKPGRKICFYNTQTVMKTKVC
jgi:hypothetical protein